MHVGAKRNRAAELYSSWRVYHPAYTCNIIVERLQRLGRDGRIHLTHIRTVPLSQLTRSFDDSKKLTHLTMTLMARGSSHAKPISWPPSEYW